MKPTLKLLPLLLFLVGSSPLVKCQNYELVWSDEFTNSVGPGWTFEVGDIGAVNNELAYYRKENVTLENGDLVITARKESFGGKNYTSGRLITLGKESFKYGKIEARIKLPAFMGSWPAFWMLGDNLNTGAGWPACGEIDIMEQVNTDHNVFGTIHWNGNEGYTHFGKNSDYVNVKDYNVYAIEWDETAIKWFVNGILYNTADIQNGVNNTWAFHNKFFFILNLAVGGAWPGYNVDDNAFPAAMYIDYVRVYQQVNTVCNNVSIPNIVQAQSYCDMNGVETETTEDTDGGLNVGYIDAGDWMTYKINVPAAGNYTVKYRIASESTGKTLQLEQAGGGLVYGTINIPNTNGWQKWETISHVIQLPAGEQDIAIATSTGGFNINWIEFNDLLTTVNKNYSDKKISVYPNPTINNFVVENISNFDFITVYDVFGRVIEKHTVKNMDSFKLGENLYSGIYIVSLTGNNSVETIRILKN